MWRSCNVLKSWDELCIMSLALGPTKLPPLGPQYVSGFALIYPEAAAGCRSLEYLIRHINHVQCDTVYLYMSKCQDVWYTGMWLVLVLLL